jgi:hypothetical protein
MSSDDTTHEPVKMKVEGTLVSRVSDTIIVDISGTAPATGTAGELFRKAAEDLPLIGGAWVGIAKVRVASVASTRLTLTLTEEESVITLNGAKINHFTAGAPIRLEWSN